MHQRLTAALPLLLLAVCVAAPADRGAARQPAAAAGASLEQSHSACAQAGFAMLSVGAVRSKNAKNSCVVCSDAGWSRPGPAPPGPVDAALLSLLARSSLLVYSLLLLSLNAPYRG